MATLEKIKICGIRSFGCEEEDVQTVRFKKPLTLILGENGCGKSTIIECLRYLTAQKEPQGKGTFVHDPSLCNRPTNKGFVKLRMLDVKGGVVDLCRQVQATRTKKSVTTKSLDNVITRTNKETKEKVSISNRCVDFTYEISRIFGVSRSILENVIFCTQEDSHWPLDTDQKLKEKFDQIFDSDKYNKCVNKVREKKKKIKDTMKNSEVELKYLKENKAMAVEKRRRLEKTRLQVNSLKDNIKDLSSSLEEVEVKLKDINEKELNMTKNHSAKEMKRAELKAIEELLAELKGRIKKPYTGTDEELENELTTFRKALSVRQEEMREDEKKMKDLEVEESMLSKKLMGEQGQLGQLVKEEELNGERIEQRNKKLIRLATDSLDMPAEALKRTEDAMDDLMRDVKIKIMDEEENLAQAKRAIEEEDEKLQSVVETFRTKVLTLENEIANKGKNLRTSQTQKEKVQRELNEIDLSATRLTYLESELGKLNEETKRLEKSTNVSELRGNIDKFTRQREGLEEHLTAVEDRLKRLQEQSSLSTELDVQTELKSNKDSQFRRLMNKHEENLRTMLGEVPDSGFKSAVQNRFVAARKKVKEVAAATGKKEKEATELEMKRKHLRVELKAKEETLRGSEEEVYEVCGGESLEDATSALRKEVEELQDVKGTLSSSEFMYQRYIRALQKTRPCCPLCHRDFERDNEARSLVEELTSKIREVPARLLENKSQLEEKQAKYNKLLTLQSKKEEICSLKEKVIPDLRLDLEQAESSLKKVQRELVELGRGMTSAQSEEALCLSLQDDMVLMDELLTERHQLEKQMEKLKSRLGIGNSNSDENNLKKVMNEYEKARQELKVARQKADEFQSKLNNYNEQLQGKQSMRNSLTEEINKIQGGAGKKQNLLERLDELEGDEAVLTVELRELEQSCEVVRQKLSDATVRRKAEKTAKMEDLEKKTRTVNRYMKDLHELEVTNKAIEAHHRKGIQKKIESVQEVMRSIEEEVADVGMRRNETARRIEQAKKGLSNQELVERELEDNVRLRQKRVQAENLRKEVEALEKKLGNVNFDALLREKRKLKGKEEEINKNKAQIQGRVAEMENQLETTEKELLGKAFRNIDETYNDENIKFEVLKAIANDLDRYATTMEYAMMTYHKQQMMKVNAFIREYWRKIYQGNDIDYIEIQTDTMESTEKRRNYNYKVVQYKSEVALDMRNRCSAGQKMLASLIIRLALAETFSNNCGILTLDEPTTNLDRKNIKNLAETLNEILMAKQNTSNPNFQLIVITHDEEFLKELMELDLVDDYVRVDRNLRGKTVIYNRPLSEELNEGYERFRIANRPEFQYD